MTQHPFDTPDGMPITFWRGAPAEGTLNPANINAYGTRDPAHVVPFLCSVGSPGVPCVPPPGSIWKVESIHATNHSAAPAWFSASIFTASAGDRSVLASPTANPLQPAVHLAWGMRLEAAGSEGSSVRIPCDEVLTYANGLWAGAWPGVNVNALGPGNDGVPGAITASFHGRILV